MKKNDKWECSFNFPKQLSKFCNCANLNLTLLTRYISYLESLNHQLHEKCKGALLPTNIVYREKSLFRATDKKQLLFDIDSILNRSCNINSNYPFKSLDLYRSLPTIPTIDIRTNRMHEIHSSIFTLGDSASYNYLVIQGTGW